MSCKHWNAMIIAEKILNSKSMRSISYADYMRACRSESVSSQPGGVKRTESSGSEMKREIAESPVEVVASNTPDSDVMLKPSFDLNMTSEVPEWLKNDLADADFIPIKPKSETQPEQQQKSELKSEIKV